MTFTHCIHLGGASDEAASGEAIADEGLQERFSWETSGFVKQ